MKYFLIYAFAIFFIILIQGLIQYAFAKDKSSFEFKELIISALGAGLLMGVAISVGNYIYEYTGIELIFISISTLVVSFYWFAINPFQFLIRKKSYIRDPVLEAKLLSKSFQFKVLKTDVLKANAMAIGIIPFNKTIILANNLEDHLSEKEQMAIVYHEIGHHKKKHLWVLFFLNIIIQFVVYNILGYVHEYGKNSLFLELSLLAITGGLMGLAYYYIPGKIMYYLEYQADSYAAQIMGKEVTSSALIKLDELSGGKLTKGNINHPNLKKRLANIQKS